jgi:uncharacterized hydantoinase/oxoprolinase family protein
VSYEAREIDLATGVVEFGGARLEKLKGETGKVYRIALVYEKVPMPAEGTPLYEVFQSKIEEGTMQQVEEDGEQYVIKTKMYNQDVHKYVKGVGYAIATENSAKILGAEAKPRFSALIIKYAVDPSNGALLKGKDGKAILDYTEMNWVFSAQVFKKLQSIDSEYPLIAHDLKLTCTDGNFNSFDIQPCKDAFWRKRPEVEAQIVANSAKHWKATARALGTVYTDDQLKDKLGIKTDDAAPIKGAVATDDEFDSIAESIA